MFEFFFETGARCGETIGLTRNNVVQLDIILRKIVYDYNRHSACTRMAEAGMNQRILQEIMGHSNLAITMEVYNHVGDKRMRDEIE